MGAGSVADEPQLVIGLDPVKALALDAALEGVWSLVLAGRTANPPCAALGFQRLTARAPQSRVSPVMSQAETAKTAQLDEAELERMLGWWEAANYLTVAQIYLQDNPLLREPLRARAHQAAAARPLGHVAGPQPDLRPASTA